MVAPALDLKATGAAQGRMCETVDCRKAAASFYATTTPLHTATLGGWTKLVQQLLTYGYDPAQSDPWGYAFICCCSSCCFFLFL
jgi:hypothetical protein